VRIQPINEPAVTAEDLLDDAKGSVVFKFLQTQLEKCYTVAPDERFRQYLNALSSSFDQRNVLSYIHMILTCISMPQVINQYKFLLEINKHQLQRVYAEPDILTRL
jgi:hypothetical protein